ncbi:MAG: PDZ domain-containing protein, partial [Calditrichaeota bacterium]
MFNSGIQRSPLPLVVFLFAAQILLQSCGPQGPSGSRRTTDRDRDGGGWIGVYVQDLDRDLREYLGVDAPYGVLVNEVLPDSPAERAGLREEDVITKFAGRRIRNTRDLTRAVEHAE